MSEAVEFALPGDRGNDFDIQGFTIHSIVRLGNEFIISGSGGHGFWLGEDGCTTDVDSVDEIEITAGIENELAAAVIQEQVEIWIERGASLQVLLCPGKYTSIIDHEKQTLLPFPRG